MTRKLFFPKIEFNFTARKTVYHHNQTIADYPQFSFEPDTEALSKTLYDLLDNSRLFVHLIFLPKCEICAIVFFVRNVY